MSIFQEIAEGIISGNAKKVREYAEKALTEGATPQAIVNEGFIAGMSVVGIRFKNNEVYVPEVLIAARAMHAGMDVIKPLLSEADVEGKGTILVGTVKGDLHDIGKNLVCMMLEGAGYKVIDLGVNVEAEKFIQAIEEYKPQIVGLSALLTTTMPSMKDTIALLKSYPVKVMIGGAPITQEFADEIGANAYAPDAASAVEKADQLLLA